MKNYSVKTLIPALLLIPVIAGLVLLLRYAIHLTSSEESPQPVSAMTKPSESNPILYQSESAKPTVSDVAVTPAMQEPLPDEEPDPSEVAPFWSEGSLFIDDTYRSPTLTVTLTVHRDSKTFRKRVVYYVADIHVRDVTQIRTVSFDEDFAKHGHGDVKTMAKKANALVAISGDYCGANHNGLIIRNGIVYREKTGYGDVCVLLKNGEMETVRKGSVNIKEIMEKDPWQVWEFGPALLDENGNARKTFPGYEITVNNPRSCIGCIEPGHYCFVVVDGRQSASRGLEMKELAELMQSLGCKQAYNLDGGASAHLYWKDRIFNKPSNNGGRQISDIIYIAKESYPSSPFFCGKAGLS
ncbi:MAG: phosphodiester glycosidase family protein [Clostridia bacterium]|nr:phosphodiester glycosidase family protein [Clostridia bacterium]